MRKLLFWTHLIAGLAAAVVVLIMSVTGVLLTYERQMIEWADGDLRFVAAGGMRLAPEALLQKLAENGGAMPESMTIRAEPNSTVEITREQKTLYVDPYSGRVVGEGCVTIRRFFRAVTNWHRWLALEGPWRQVGRSITGASNLAFLFLAVSGMYLWLPRKWSWPSVRAVVWFRGGLSAKARDFNWHNTVGIWSAIPLIAVIAGAAVISYPWATKLVYRLAGSEPPPPASAQRRPAGGPARPERGAPDFTGLNLAFDRARSTVAEWQTLSWRPGGGKTFTIAVAGSHRGRVDLRSAVTIDRATGAIVQSESFSDYSRGRRWRSWLRFIHTGEALGVVGQTIAGLVSAGAVVLAYTGVMLSWRRFRAWRERTRRGNAVASETVPA